MYQKWFDSGKFLKPKVYKTYDQLSFHSDKTIKTLIFVESIEV